MFAGVSAETRAMDFDVAQRIAAAVSLVLGIVILLAAFARLRPRQGSSAWFLQFAIPANVVLSVGILLGETETAGSSLCRTQATLVQFGIIANFLWYLATGTTVYLNQRLPSSSRTTKLYRLAIILAYGLSLAISLPFSFSSSSSRGPIYEPTHLWCTISTTWQPLRLVFMFVPAWMQIVSLPVLCYVLYIHRPEFPMVTLEHPDEHAPLSPSIPNSSVQPTRTSTPIPPTEDPFTGLKITSITITSEKGPQPSISTRSTHSQNQVSKALEYLRKPPFALRHESATTLVLDPVQADVEQRGYRQYEYNISTSDLPKSAIMSVDIVREKGLPGLDVHEEHSTYNLNRRDFFRVGVLLWLALLITWIPYSVVEIYTLASHTPPHSLLLTTAATFPLQGFWQGLLSIYLQRSSIRDAFARR